MKLCTASDLEQSMPVSIYSLVTRVSLSCRIHSTGTRSLELYHLKTVNLICLHLHVCWFTLKPKCFHKLPWSKAISGCMLTHNYWGLACVLSVGLTGLMIHDHCEIATYLSSENCLFVHAFGFVFELTEANAVWLFTAG